MNSRCLFVFLLLTTLLEVRAVHAAPRRRITIAFEVRPAERPKYVCVFSDAADARAVGVKALKKFLVPDLAKGKWVVDQAALERHEKEFGGSEIVLRALRAVSAARPASKTKSVSEPNGNAQEPSECSAQCDPYVVIDSPDKGNLLCEVNSQYVDGPERTVFVRLDFLDKDASPVVKDLYVDGSVATVYLEATNEQDQVNATVRGGSYADDTSSVERVGIMTLPLKPRCVATELILPPSEEPPLPQSRGGRMQVYVLHDPPLYCRDPEVLPGNRLRIDVPYVERGAQTEIAVWGFDPNPSTASDEPETRATTPDKDELDFAYVARFGPLLPPPELQHRVRQLSFSWRRHPCSAARAPQGEQTEEQTEEQTCTSCPEVEAPGGIQCRLNAGATTSSQCAYRCGDSATQEFDLPLTLSFRSPGSAEDAWTDTLYRVGQELKGYLHPDERRVAVSWEKWPNVAQRAEARADPIEEVTVWSRDGSEYSAKPGELTFIPLGSSRCGGSLRYLVKGNQVYEEGWADIVHGQLILPDPAATVRAWRMWLALGGGGIGTISSKNGGNNALVEALATLAWRPWVAHTFELQSGFLFAKRRYSRLAENPTPETPARETAFSGRVPVVFSYVYNLNESFRLGFGGGLMLGDSLFAEDRQRIGPVDASMILPQLTIRFVLSRDFELAVNGRALWFEELNSFTSTDLNEAPRLERESIVQWTAGATLGYAFWTL